MYGYHYSPCTNAKSIAKHGLLVPTKHPRLVTPVVCSQGHRNPHISLGRTPEHAWRLSGGFLKRRAKENGIEITPQLWYLYQVGLTGIRYYPNEYELKVRNDIPRSHIVRVGKRWTNE